MRNGSCQREGELLDALGRGFVPAELEAHVTDCPSCSELRTVAGALLDERSQALVEAPVPASGTMWWRMRIRHRQEARARARRSLRVGQGVSLAVAGALMILLFGNEIASGLRELAATIRPSTPLLVALAVVALVTPIAGWVALRQK